MAKYIKREEMSSALSELLESPYANHDSLFCAGIRDCLKLVKNMVDDKVSDTLKIPDADVRENVRGEWIDWFPPDFCLIMTGEEALVMCSICESKFVNQHNFCPHCGADMRPPEEKHDGT